jgi:hypothetical protein
MSKTLFAILLYYILTPSLVGQGQQPEFCPGEVLLCPKPGRAGQARQLIDAENCSVREVDAVSGLLRVNVPVGKEAGLIAQWGKHPDVEYVERNAIGYADIIPNDTSFGIQWHLQNNGQTGGTVGADIRATDAWDLTTGSPNVVIAVLDSGIDSDHPEFAGRIDANAYDFVYNDNDPEAVFPHGTIVSGVLCANGNNGFGVAGVDWQCQLLPLQVIDDLGQGNQFDLIQAINYTTTLPNVHVLSMSLSYSYSGPSLANALQAAYAAGKIMIASASNTGFGGADNHSPSSSPYTISIGATDNTDLRAGFSGTGAALDFVAPGTFIVTTQNNTSANTYTSASGCSMAVPMVAGVLGLAFARAEQVGVPYPTQTTAYELLRAGALDQVGPASQDPPGRDDLFGHGRIDARLVLDAVPTVLFDCAAGRVGAGLGVPYDVLRINGQATVNGERTIAVPVGVPVTLSMDVPQSLPVPSPLPPLFVIAARAGGATSGLPTTLPFGWGVTCFDPMDPATILTLAGTAPWSVVTPPVPAGFTTTLQGVVLHTPQGDLAVTNQVSFDPVIFPAPVIDSIEPLWATQGTPVQLVGSGFLPGATILVSGQSISPTSVGASIVTFAAPASTSCDIAVTLLNPDGQADSGIFNATPVITSLILPLGAPAAGGTPIWIVGENLASNGATAPTVTIGGAPLTIIGSSRSVIMGYLPPGNIGPAAIIVTASSGCAGTDWITYTP